MSDRIYFPDIRAPGWPFVEQHEDTSLRTKFEDGSMQTRSKFTRSRRKWTLHWNNLPRRQYLVLVHFITKVVKFSCVWGRTGPPQGRSRSQDYPCGRVEERGHAVLVRGYRTDGGIGC